MKEYLEEVSLPWTLIKHQSGRSIDDIHTGRGLGVRYWLLYMKDSTTHCVTIGLYMGILTMLPVYGTWLSWLSTQK